MTHKLLGKYDEPQTANAVVAVHYGDHYAQEIWVASSINDGSWYPLGGERWTVWKTHQMPPGVTKDHPTWTDVLARGPVVLLTPGDATTYTAGWKASRRRLLEQIEDLGDEQPESGDPR